MLFDFIVLVLAALGVLIGMKRGFARSVISLAACLAALIFSALLTSAVLSLIFRSSLFYNFIVGDVSFYSLYKSLPFEYGDSRILSALYSPLMQRIQPYLNAGWICTETGVAATAEQLMPCAMALHSAVVAIGLLVYFTLRILLILATYILRSFLKKDEKPSKPSRVGGSIVAVVHSVIVVAILSMLFSMFVPSAAGENGKKSSLAIADGFIFSGIYSLAETCFDGIMVKDEHLEKVMKVAGFSAPSQTE